MRKIIYTRPDGGLSVVHPVRNTHPTRETLANAEVEARAWGTLPEDAINPQWVDEVPQDREFRNAWKANGAGIAVDMSKARDLHRNKLRELRKPKLEALDVEYMRADEAQDLSQKNRIVQKKQALRDVTADPMIDAAKTPDELKRSIPAVLKDS